MNAIVRHGSLLERLSQLAAEGGVRGAVLRAATGWACVLVAFGVYHLTVGWWIAPEQAPQAAADAGTPPPGRSTTQSNPSMKHWFGSQPDAWELRNPKVLRTDQGILLFKKYKVLRGGRVKIWPCSLVLLPREDVADRKLRQRQAIILQAPEGAILQFDRDFDLRRGQVGQLDGGLLLGKITIRSQGRSPGPEDDLWLSTYDVKLSRDSVYTPHPVQFRLGANYGSGRELFIQLVQQKGRGRRAQLQVESLELKNDVSLHLVLQGKKKQPATRGKQAPAGRQATAAAAPAAGKLSLVAEGPQPLDVSCTGPMRIDFLRHEVTFQQDVVLLRRWKEGPPDRLTANRLRLTFTVEAPSPPEIKPASKQKKKNAKPQAAPSRRQAAPDPLTGRWKIQLIEASGHPAVLTAPRSALLARGHRLAYHVPTGRVELEDLRQGLLQHRRNRLRAKKLIYEPGQAGSLGRFEATGRGDIRWLLQPRSNMPAAPGTQRRQPSKPQVLEAAWGQQMQGRPGPQGTYQVTLLRDAMLRAWGQGELRAQRMEITLHRQLVAPAAGEPPRTTYRPRRLVAQAAVRVASPQLAVETETLVVEFLQPGGAAPAPGRPQKGPAAAPPARTGFRSWPGGPWPQEALRPRRFGPAVPVVPVVDRRTASGTHGAPLGNWRGLDRQAPGRAFVGREQSYPGVSLRELTLPACRGVPQAAFALAPRGQGRRLQAAPVATRRYELRGKQVQLWLLDAGGEPQPEHLLVTGQAQLRELLQSPGAEKPLVLRGDRIQAQQLSGGRGQVRIEGHPAHLEGRALVLQGPVIQLDQGANRLWIDSAGKMWVLVDRSWRGTVDGARQPLVVQWMGSMQFDGRKATFDRAVVARRGDDHLQTETLEVHLKDPLVFQQGARQTRAQLARIVCRQGVFAQSRQYDARGLVSWEQMSAADLSINQISGAVVAQGPGWLRRVMRADQVKDSGAALPGGGKPRQNLPLRFLGVTFRKSLSGNLHRREMLFSGQVEVVYGPVAHWEATLDADQPERLGPGGIAIHCEKLSLAQLPAAGGSWSLEIQATENTVIEGALFTARAHRAAYSQAKERLVLEGTARSPALLQRRPYPGGPASTATARKILYWRKTNQVRVEDARSLDLAQPPRPTPR